MNINAYFITYPDVEIDPSTPITQWPLAAGRFAPWGGRGYYFVFDRDSLALTHDWQGIDTDPEVSNDER